MKTAEPTIRRMVLKRFRSVLSECVCFDNPTILVGRNGAGKSNLVSAFSFLADAMTVPLQEAFDRAGGISVVRNRLASGSRPQTFGIRVDFGLLRGAREGSFYAFEVSPRSRHGFSVHREQGALGSGATRVWFERNGSGFRSNMQGLAPPVDHASLVLPTIGGSKDFHEIWRGLSRMRVYAIDPNRLRQAQKPTAGHELKADGSNVASVLREMTARSAHESDRISRTLGTIIPNLESFTVKDAGGDLILEFTQRWGKQAPQGLGFDASIASAGTLRAVGVLAAAFQLAEPTLIAMEDPDAGIHPGALGTVLETLEAASQRTQVVITTHNPELLDSKRIRDRYLRMVEWYEGATRVADVSDANRGVLRERLAGAGELLRTNVLEPSPMVYERREDVPLFEELH